MVVSTDLGLALPSDWCVPDNSPKSKPRDHSNPTCPEDEIYFIIHRQIVIILTPGSLLISHSLHSLLLSNPWAGITREVGVVQSPFPAFPLPCYHHPTRDRTSTYPIPSKHFVPIARKTIGMFRKAFHISSPYSGVCLPHDKHDFRPHGSRAGKASQH